MPDWFTLLGIGLITAAIMASMRGHDRLSLGLMLLSVACDFLDGFLASRVGGSAYGKLLDGSYDVLGYLVFPTVYLFSHFQSMLWLVPAGLAILTGCLRLARFQATGLAEGGKSYVGLPVFYLALVPMAVYFGINQLIIAGLMLASSIVMISQLKTPKPRHPLFLILLVALGLGFILWPA